MDACPRQAQFPTRVLAERWRADPLEARKEHDRCWPDATLLKVRRQDTMNYLDFVSPTPDQQACRSIATQRQRLWRKMLVTAQGLWKNLARRHQMVS